GDVIPGIARGASEIESPLCPEVVDDVAAGVVILAAECHVVSAPGPARRVAELYFVADEVVRVARVDAADGLKLDVKLVVLIERDRHAQVVPILLGIDV